MPLFTVYKMRKVFEGGKSVNWRKFALLQINKLQYLYFFVIFSKNKWL